MNNTIESIKAALLNPENPANQLFGSSEPDACERNARVIMERRTLAILAAQTECPASCMGYIAHLQSPTLSASVMHDAIRQLHGRISREAWHALYTAFIDSTGGSDGDLERFTA